MMKRYHYEVIDSTNTEAKRILRKEINIENLKLPFVISANSQTAGRGRQGKSFYSPAETGIYMSVVNAFSDDYTADMLTIKVSLAVRKAILDITGINTGIKWVNDLYYNSRKICGILTETINVLGDDDKSQNQYVIIGIGINLSTKEFPSEISNIAGSIGIGNEIDEIKKALYDEIAYNILNLNNIEEFKISEYKKHSIVIGKKISFYQNNKMYEAIAIDIDEKGALIAKTNDGNNYILQSGEISIVKW